MSEVLLKRQLDELYAELPTLICQGKCQSSCGQIGMTRVERRRIVKRTGREPSYDEQLRCSLLRDGQCSVYQIRPLICRLWGVVETLACPWGCKPEPRYLTYEEGQEFLLRADDIGATPDEQASNEKMRELLGIR